MGRSHSFVEDIKRNQVDVQMHVERREKAMHKRYGPKICVRKRWKIVIEDCQYPCLRQNQ